MLDQLTPIETQKSWLLSSIQVDLGRIIFKNRSIIRVKILWILWNIILEHFEQLEHALNNQIQSRTQFLCQMSPQLISKLI